MLVLLAINSVLATYSTMVMAEAPFLVFFVVTLFALERWAAHPGALNATAVVVLLAYLVWLKEAGIGLAVGLMAYELWRRCWRRAAAVGTGTALLLLPGLVARWVSGGAVVGDRYADEIVNATKGGLLHQVVSEAPKVAWSYLRNVLRESVLPEGSPLPSHGTLDFLMTIVGVSVPVFVILGAVMWYRRQSHPEVWMVGAYLAETLAYPFTNERRVILVLPVATIWYVLGAGSAGRWVLSRARADLKPVVLPLGVTTAVLLLVVPTAAGFNRNYLWTVGQRSSEFAGSPAVTLLAAIGYPEEVVETDYRGTIAYFTNHRTAWTAFSTTTPYGPLGDQNPGRCRIPIVQDALRGDDAKFVVVGDFNGPGFTDSPCLLQLATTPSAARALNVVRLLSTSHDQTSVFELLGPGTPQPGLVDWTTSSPPLVSVAPDQVRAAETRSSDPAVQLSRPARAVALSRNGQGDQGGTGYVAPADQGRSELTWYWRAPVPIVQLSVGSVNSATSISYVTASIQTPTRSWRVVARAMASRRPGRGALPTGPPAGGDGGLSRPSDSSYLQRRRNHLRERHRPGQVCPVSASARTGMGGEERRSMEPARSRGERQAARAARRAQRRQEERQSEVPLHLLGVRQHTVTLVTVLCILFSLFTLVPIVYMAFSATKSQLNINDSFPFWFARPFVLFQNVSLLFENLGGDGVFARWFANTVVYASLGGGGATIISVMAGYGFARFNFRGARFGFALVIGTLLVPITAISLPLYLVYAKAHLINSIWGMVLPSMVSPIGVYLMRTFSATHLSRALLDAARIDGAGEVRIFFDHRASPPGPWHSDRAADQRG